MPGSVIQGCFPHGLPRFAGVAQPKLANAIPLPPHVPPLATRGGQPLPNNVRQAMEKFFGTRFDDVRVHVGTHAATLGASALTHGSNIHFAPGRYEMHSARGRELLAHELAHVVQQSSARVSNPFGSGIAIVHDPRLEAEAARSAHVVQAFWTEAAMIGGAAVVGAIAAPLVGVTAATGAIVGGAAGLAYTVYANANAPVAVPAHVHAPVPVAHALPPPVHVAPQHVLTAPVDRHPTREVEGEVGYFTRFRDWNVRPPAAGIIVQEVWRTFTVHRIDTGALMSGADIDNYVRSASSAAFATDTHYWELWPVAGDGTVGDGGEDCFGLCAIIPGGRRVRRNTTRGRFVMRGRAHFYATTAIPHGFSRVAVNAANGLYATTVAPALPPPASNAVDFTVTVTWDSTTGQDLGTTVVET